ncbi:MAG: TOBE domain-containing protein [Eudoraea sp.]|nr:TOBE domain-containing protein [Eudoraea sp.]
MNRLKGHIEHLEISGDLTLVTVLLIDEIRIKAIVIDTPKSAPYLKKGGKVAILFKETEVVIGDHNDHKISLQNRMLGILKTIEQGHLLSSLTVETAVGNIRSTISTAAVLALKLEPGSKIMAMVKLNEVMLSPL